MLNLFKLPFGFGNKKEKPVPTTDIALNIFKKFVHQTGKDDFPFAGRDENEFIPKKRKGSNLNIQHAKEEFYEIMSKRLRNIDRELNH